MRPFIIPIASAAMLAISGAALSSGADIPRGWDEIFRDWIFLVSRTDSEGDLRYGRVRGAEILLSQATMITVESSEFETKISRPTDGTPNQRAIPMLGFGSLTWKVYPMSELGPAALQMERLHEEHFLIKSIGAQVAVMVLGVYEVMETGSLFALFVDHKDARRYFDGLVTKISVRAAPFAMLTHRPHVNTVNPDVSFYPEFLVGLDDFAPDMINPRHVTIAIATPKAVPTTRTDLAHQIRSLLAVERFGLHPLQPEEIQFRIPATNSHCGLANFYRSVYKKASHQQSIKKMTN